MIKRGLDWMAKLRLIEDDFENMILISFARQ